MLIPRAKVPFNFELCGSRLRQSNSLARLINSQVDDQNWADPYRFLTNPNESSRGFCLPYIEYVQGIAYLISML